MSTALSFSHAMQFVLALAIFLGVLFTSASPASAIPAFSRKYNLSCGSCHTKPPHLNRFGEAFHMAGFQIPAVPEGEIHAKQKIGRIMSETNFLNIFAVRTTGDFIRSYSGSGNDELSIVLPQKVVFYLAGNVMDGLSYFFELEQEALEIHGTQKGGFEEASRFGIGDEFFLMIDLPHLWKEWGGAKGHGAVHHDSGAMIHGPMIMAGKIDPSTNFSYPTNRQFIANLPGRVNPVTGTLDRVSLAPYAFASKFSGVMTAEGESVEVTQPVLYNTTGDFGIDAHTMIGPVLISTGLMQGLLAGPNDHNQKKDPYLMGRVNFGGAHYFSGSLSGLLYRGFDTARIPISATQTSLVDWVRTGVAGNIQYRFLDLYGAFIQDTLKGVPEGDPFQNKASGVTLEADYLATNRTLLSLRYDQLKGGGLGQKPEGKMTTAQMRYYLRDNFSFYVRESYAYQDRLHPFKALTAIGLDFDF